MWNGGCNPPYMIASDVHPLAVTRDGGFVGRVPPAAQAAARIAPRMHCDVERRVQSALQDGYDDATRLQTPAPAISVE
jgi:hypothetical protein